MLKFNLIQNASDSFEHAIEHLTARKKLSTGDYKRVFLDLSHVSELLFKERLRMIHPAFVLTNVDKYPSSSAHTVSAEVALSRLQKIGGIEFNETDKSALKIMRDKRNEIEHFEFTIAEKEARVTIGNILVFIFRFSCDEIGIDWASRRLDDPKWFKLNEYAEFYEKQKEHVLETIYGSGLPMLDCPMCNNETFDVEAEVCLLCGHREDVLECSVCKADYLFSSTEFEAGEICPACEWKEGYAAANFEKY